MVIIFIHYVLVGVLISNLAYFVFRDTKDHLSTYSNNIIVNGDYEDIVDIEDGVYLVDIKYYTDDTEEYRCLALLDTVKNKEAVSDNQDLSITYGNDSKVLRIQSLNGDFIVGTIGIKNV